MLDNYLYSIFEVFQVLRMSVGEDSENGRYAVVNVLLLPHDTPLAPYFHVSYVYFITSYHHPWNCIWILIMDSMFARSIALPIKVRQAFGQSFEMPEMHALFVMSHHVVALKVCAIRQSINTRPSRSRTHASNNALHIVQLITIT